MIIIKNITKISDNQILAKKMVLRLKD